jgi:UDP-3-O-[3-hydroxymyristoyl] glucosamine N-acyltransferase
MRVKELAEWLGAEFEGAGDVEITGVAPIEGAGPADISFINSRKAAQQAAATAAGCLIVPMDFASRGRTVIRAEAPRVAFARVVGRLHPRRRPEPGIHPTAVIAPNVRISGGVSIGPHVSIGEGSSVGSGTIIGAGSRIGGNVAIGEGGLLHANVTIYDDVRIGRGVILHSGCVIGADGFGFVMEGGRYAKFPQVGRVEIGDFVEIGANACIDRAALGVTSIGEGAKIDNMVHVGHNCTIGRHVVIAAQTGFSGGVVVGDYAVIGGQVGIGDQARIEPGAVLGSGCGILTSKIVRSGQVLWGTPARPLKEYLAQLAHLARLPRLLKEIREELAELKRRLARLEPA